MKKAFDPYQFDPHNNDYQEDIRMATAEAEPDEYTTEDCKTLTLVMETAYYHLFKTEIVWTVSFFGIWSAFEPDVSE